MSMRYVNMVLTVETVTPGIAAKWLQANDCNRRIRAADVARYERAMLRGEWQCKPLAVCFDDQGRLGNGQHTLSAITKSGVSQQLLVARNCSRDQIASMDMGRARTINDIAHFIGAEITSKKASVAKVIVFGPTEVGAKSFQELFEAYQKHSDKIEMVLENTPKKSGFSAPVLAVCVKAMYHHESRNVMRFLEIMSTGIVHGPHEEAAIRLRDLCNSVRAGTTSARVEIYQKAMSALQYFLEGRRMSKLYGTCDDLFPCPDVLESGSRLGLKAA